MYTLKAFALVVACAVAAHADVVEHYTLYRNASEVGFQLESPKITDFGSWGEPEICSSGKVVTGFQLKMEPKHSIDDTALNGIRFFCGTPGGSNDERRNITSKVGYFGNWGRIFNCSTYAVGFELQSQEYQGPRTDDIAANNFKMYCADGVIYEGFHDNGHTFKNSIYTGPQMCSLGKAMCGIQTQIERYQVFGDDTSLNNVRAKCCSVAESAGDLLPGAPNIPVIGVTEAPAASVQGESTAAESVPGESASAESTPAPESFNYY